LSNEPVLCAFLAKCWGLLGQLRRWPLEAMLLLSWLDGRAATVCHLSRMGPSAGCQR